MATDPDDDLLLGPIPDPDAEPTTGERAHAKTFAELVDKTLAGRTPPAISADDRALIEVATVIRAAHGGVTLPANRQRAIDFILREVKAARGEGLKARLLVPLTRHHGSAALQFELELARLDQLDQFRERGVGTGEETGNWMRAFSEILVAPPAVEILRVAEATE